MFKNDSNIFCKSIYRVRFESPDAVSHLNIVWFAITILILNSQPKDKDKRKKGKACVMAVYIYFKSKIKARNLQFKY